MCVNDSVQDEREKLCSPMGRAAGSAYSEEMNQKRSKKKRSRCCLLYAPSQLQRSD